MGRILEGLQVAHFNWIRPFPLLRLNTYGFAVALAVAITVWIALANSQPAYARKCYSADQATKMINKDVCVTAHIYDVVEVSDGTRFLDVCPPETLDANCRFTILSLYEDRKDVGELLKYRNSNVQVRGIVISIRGRAAIVLSHARQFHDAPPHFRPNPMLARGFDAEQDRPPVLDPNLRHQGGARGFMNNRDQVARPVK